MIKRLLQLTLMLALVAPVALAEAEKPVVALLRFGPMFNFDLVQTSLLGALQVSGVISATESETDFTAGEELDGDSLRIIMGDAAMDFSNVNFIVEAALDEGADALITFSTPVTLAALNATLDMDEPPLVIFASVYNAYAAGIAQSSCIKPEHVTGVQSVTRYEDIVPLVLLQNPEIQTIGTIYSASETSGVIGAQEIVAAAEALSLTVEQAAVTSVADLIHAAEGLVSKGVEAFLIPADLLTVAGLPTLMQVGVENSIPVFHSTGNAVNDGATVSAGATETGLQGRLIGALLSAYLRGELDAASTGIGSVSDLSISVNLDVAAMQGIEISEALIARADSYYEDGVASGRRITEALESMGLQPDMIKVVSREISKAMGSGGKLELDLPPEVLQILRAALASQDAQAELTAALTALHCTDDMIAEQQAALDAAED